MIPVERAQVGMVLTVGVSDLRGRLLIPAGKELTDRYLECLPMWGVTHVEIEGDDPGAEETARDEFEPWAMEKAEEVVDDHFRLTNREHPFISALRPVCVARRAAEIQRAGEP